MSWFIKCLKQYVDFSGRARRKEYWYFVLFDVIISFISYGLDLLFKTTINHPYFNIGWFNIAVGAFLILPYTAVVVRRFHDINKSVWFLVIVYVSFGTYFLSVMRYIANPEQINITIFFVFYFIFLAFSILLSVLMLFDSVPGMNKWGPNPKGVGNHVYAPEVIFNAENIFTKPVEADKPKEAETKAEDVVITEPDEKEEKIKKDDDNNII